MTPSPVSCFILYLLPGALLGRINAKWVEGHVDTKENWAFLSRFCFLSLEGQFEYLIEFEREMGIPNLLLYYDDDSQWPSVYHSSLSCKEREVVLNKGGQNQIIKLSHWYPETEYSGCIVKRANKEMPAVKSSSTTVKPTTKRNILTTILKDHKTESPRNTSYYDQFLKATTPKSKFTTPDSNLTTWYELLPTGQTNFSTTMWSEDDLWETISPDANNGPSKNLKDVEILFDNNSTSGHKIKRSTSELYERYRRRRLNSVASSGGGGISRETEKLIVSCHNSRRFRSARERWWFIAISNCDSPKGLDVRYKFLMTNGPNGDFWHEHFSADEFYVLPILLAYTLGYVMMMVAVVMCSVELKSRHLLHSTYKLFLVSVVAQHCGVIIQVLAAIRYAITGTVYLTARITGQFLCGVSEMTFLLLLVLMAKGYTITRGRLKVAFTVKLTVFMCCYIVTYIVLFVYQAKMFDPGEVLYLYESPAGYGVIVLRVTAWCAFAYATFFTVKKYPEKNTFYCPFFICGTLWFYAGPLFILTANSYIDKWVRESVVTAVLLFITFTGHIMFLLLTLPVFANKNFPYHVRTTQIGVMEVFQAGSTNLLYTCFCFFVYYTDLFIKVTGSSSLDGFGTNAYHPSNGAAQTVIIPLTRRTEELIGNMYSQYMASAPPLSLDNETPRLNGYLKQVDSKIIQNGLTFQNSTETNTSEDIKPVVKDNDKEIFTVENQMAKIDSLANKNNGIRNHNSLVQENDPTNVSSPKNYFNEKPLSHNDSENKIASDNEILQRTDLPNVLRPRRNILEPIKKEDVPSWSLAKGPCVVATQKKAKSMDNEERPEEPSGSLLLTNGKKVPPVRNGLRQNSGEISTIHEGHIQNYQNIVSKATIDLFNAGGNKT